MKRFYGIILLFTALIAFRTNVKAQVYPCAGITVEVTGACCGGSTYDNYATKVTLDQIYQQDITVNVTMYRDGNRSINTTFSITVPAGA